jgi:hypothetical protein
VNIPGVSDVLAALFRAAEPEPEAELDYYGPCDRLEPEPEPEAQP